MKAEQIKVAWTGTVVSIQPRSTVWRYLIDNRTHRECGYNVFLKGSVAPLESGDFLWDVDSYCESHRANALYDYSVAISDKQAQKLLISIGDELKGTAWTTLYPETEFASFYRAGGLKKLSATGSLGSLVPLVSLTITENRSDGTPIPRVDSSKYPGPPWRMIPPPLEVYYTRMRNRLGERMPVLFKNAIGTANLEEALMSRLINIIMYLGCENADIENAAEKLKAGAMAGVLMDKALSHRKVEKQDDDLHVSKTEARSVIREIGDSTVLDVGYRIAAKWRRLEKADGDRQSTRKGTTYSGVIAAL